MKVNQEIVIPILGRTRSLVLFFDVHEKFHFLFHLTSRYVPHQRKSFARLWRKAQGLGGWLPSENSVEIPMIENDPIHTHIYILCIRIKLSNFIDDIWRIFKNWWSRNQIQVSDTVVSTILTIHAWGCYRFSKDGGTSVIQYNCNLYKQFDFLPDCYKQQELVYPRWCNI